VGKKSYENGKPILENSPRKPGQGEGTSARQERKKLAEEGQKKEKKGGKTRGPDAALPLSAVKKKLKGLAS